MIKTLQQANEELLEAIREADKQFVEYNQIDQNLIQGIAEAAQMVATGLHAPIQNTLGFTAEDEDRMVRHLQETGEYVDPRYILEEGYQEMNQRDRDALNQQGIDFPRESKKKESDFTSLPNSTLAETPSPYDKSYNQTMGIAQQTAIDPIKTQQAYQAGSDATPDPGVLGQLQNQMEEEAQLQQMYPDVPIDMARQWNQRQQQQQQSPGHPMQTAEQQTSAGQVATNTSEVLPSATTSKVAAWKDANGNILANGKLYKMTSSEYEVPDYVRIVNNGSNLDIFIPRGNINVTLDEKEIRESNYTFEPVDNKESSFLSESNLTTFEQKELINEDGVARNMDRLNLEGTHYPSLMQTSKNDKINTEEIPLQDFFIEDLDLFI
jgi:hypothetical protein